MRAHMFLDGCDWRRLTHSNKCYKVAQVCSSSLFITIFFIQSFLFQCSVWLAFKSYDKLHSFHKVPFRHFTSCFSPLPRLTAISQRFDGHKFVDDKGAASSSFPAPCC